MQPVSQVFYRVAGIVTACALLSACLAAVGAATVVGIDVTHDRRSVGSYIDDNTVELKIRQRLFTEESLKKTTNISVTSMNGVVLLTGQTPSESQRQTALAIARSFDEVKQVVNEIQIAGKAGLGSQMNDAGLTAKVKTRLFQANNLDATRVKVVSEDRSVYLMGLITETEANSAVQAAREVKGVRRVVKVFEYLAE
jgi:osmotically-inducible protein OsmY